MTEPWTWRVADADDNGELGLLYEPGNWGDVIKGEWALRLLRHLPPGPLRLLDPFAGAPAWPLLPAAVDRLRRCEELPPIDGGGPLLLPSAQAPHGARGELASTAGLLIEAARAAGRPLEARVTDADGERRARWEGRDGVRVLPTDDGLAALEAGWTDATLVHVDPFDLFERHELLAPAVACAPDACVLFYLYNKAPRSAAALRSYEQLRRTLDHARGGGRSLLVGRLPSDARLPRAFHEVLLLAPLPVARAARPSLEAATRALVRGLAEEGCFEAH